MRYLFRIVSISLFTADFFSRDFLIYFLSVVWNSCYGANNARIIHKTLFSSWFAQGILFCRCKFYYTIGFLSILSCSSCPYISVCSLLRIMPDCILVSQLDTFSGVLISVCILWAWSSCYNILILFFTCLHAFYRNFPFDVLGSYSYIGMSVARVRFSAWHSTQNVVKSLIDSRRKLTPNINECWESDLLHNFLYVVLHHGCRILTTYTRTHDHKHNAE